MTPIRSVLLIVAGIVCPVWSTPQGVEEALSERSLNRVSFKVCLINPEQRQECGGYGITEEQCYARECCWGAEDHDVGAPWCYHSKLTASKICAASEEDPEDCGWPHIRMEQCLAVGCCWRPSAANKRAPCIQKRRLPVYEGECGLTPIKPKVRPRRVIGGEDSIPHSWPWMVSLQVSDEHFCGGSLINHEWVLTAAHCHTEDPIVVLGAHNVSSEDYEKTKVMVPVDKMIPHPKYAYLPSPVPGSFGGVGYDYMLVKMARPVEFNDVIAPVCLTDITPNDGKYCYSMGWGSDEIEMSEDGYVFLTPDLLQQFMSPVIGSDRCNSTDMYNGRISPTSMCAGYEEGGRGNCFADDGGPLVCMYNGRWQQVGIVSWAEPCALAMFPTVYAEVFQMVQWIEEIVAEN